jgi:polar amino acid transport system permease protein
MSMTSLTPSEAEALPSLPPTHPAKVVPLALASLAFTVAAAVCAALALAAVRTVAEPSPLFTVLLWVLAVACFLPALAATRALLTSRRRARLIAGDDLVGARKVAALGREYAAIAMGYSLAVLIGASILGFVTANDGAVASTFLRWEFIEQAWSGVSRAFWVNVRVAVGAEVFVLVLGLVVAVMRLLPGRAGRPLRWLATLYVDVFRAIPSIIVLYLVGFGLSLAEVPIVRDFSPIWLAIFALTLTYAGYVAEVYRAGIESIHPSQWSAARSLGLSYGMTLRTVIVPQAVRRIVPPLLNDFIGLQKDTALIGVMGVTDAFTQSRLVASNVFNLTPVIVVALLFVIITIPQARFVDRLISREQARRAGKAS